MNFVTNEGTAKYFISFPVKTINCADKYQGHNALGALGASLCQSTVFLCLCVITIFIHGITGASP